MAASAGASNLNYLTSTLQPWKMTSVDTAAFARRGYAASVLPGVLPDPYKQRSMPLNTGESFPGVSQYNGIQSMPDSFEEAQNMSIKSGSLSDVRLTFGYHLQSWDGGYERWMLEGAPLFCLREITIENAQLGMYPILDLRAVGEILAIKGIHAQKVIQVYMLNKPSNPKKYKKTQVVEEYSFTYQDLFDLLTTHTDNWMKMKQFAKLLEVDDENAQCIPYLCPEYMKSRWNFCGYQLGQHDIAAFPSRECTAMVGGVTISAQNVWGPNLTNCQKLFFVWMGKNSIGGDFLYTIVKPVHNPTYPTTKDVTYKSWNAFVSHGIIVPAGTWIWYSYDKEQPSQEIYDEQAGQVLFTDVKTLTTIRVPTGRLLLVRRHYIFEN